MGIFAWIILGVIAGAIAKLITPADHPGSLIITTLIGSAGALVGGFVGSALGFGPAAAFNFAGFMVAIVGGILLLWPNRVIDQ